MHSLRESGLRLCIPRLHRILCGMVHLPVAISGHCAQHCYGFELMACRRQGAIESETASVEGIAAKCRQSVGCLQQMLKRTLAVEAMG
eukprot:2826535-Amphidinium_carterae.2